jgi:hypothetical protein
LCTAKSTHADLVSRFLGSKGDPLGPAGR